MWQLYTYNYGKHLTTTNYYNVSTIWAVFALTFEKKWAFSNPLKTFQDAFLMY